jgi:hypothetical protein
MKRKQLRIPLAVAFVVVSAVGTANVVSCGDDGQSRECQVFCVYTGSDNGNCPFPTCATGSNLDVCPTGCMPEPVV